MMELFCENIFPKKLYHRFVTGSYIRLCYLNQTSHDETFIGFIYVRHLKVFRVFNSGCLECPVGNTSDISFGFENLRIDSN